MAFAPYVPPEQLIKDRSEYARKGVARGRSVVAMANAYSQALSTIFTTQMKPYEVEILVGQVGDGPGSNELYHILFDGSVTDERDYVAMGGRSDDLGAQLKEGYRDVQSLQDAIRSC